MTLVSTGQAQKDMVINTQTTFTEFEAFIAAQTNGEKRFELINGEIVEKMVTQRHGYIAGLLITELNLYLRKNPIGRAFVEARYKMPDDEANSRIPDLSFVTQDNPLVSKGAAPYMPDLAIEIQSPDDSPKMMREKARYYLANGTHLVWLIYPDLRVIETYSADDEQIITAQGTLTGGDVLPDFALSVAELLNE